MTAQRRTGFVCHELYMWHDTGNYAGPMPYGNPVQPDIHAENPETKRRFRNLMEVSGMAEVVHHFKPRAATEAEILRFHTPEHLKNVQEISAGTGGSYYGIGAEAGIRAILNFADAKCEAEAGVNLDGLHGSITMSMTPISFYLRLYAYVRAWWFSASWGRTIYSWSAAKWSQTYGYELKF